MSKTFKIISKEKETEIEKKIKLLISSEIKNNIFMKQEQGTIREDHSEVIKPLLKIKNVIAAIKNLVSILKNNREKILKEQITHAHTHTQEKLREKIGKLKDQNRNANIQVDFHFQNEVSEKLRFRNHGIW